MLTRYCSIQNNVNLKCDLKRKKSQQSALDILTKIVVLHASTNVHEKVYKKLI